MSDDKIMILHISDMHFLSNFECFEVIDSITKVFNEPRFEGINQLIVAITGDLAYSGKKEEYVKCEEFIESLLNKLQANAIHTNIYIIPGNHDIDYNSINNVVYCENDLQGKSNYDRFVAKYDCQLGNNEFGKIEKELSIKNYNIKIELLDTTLGSKKSENDQGKHRCKDNTVLSECLSIKEYDYKIMLMHHAYYYFAEGEQLNKVRDYLNSNIDLVLVVHEHITRSEENNDVIIKYGNQYSAVDNSKNTLQSSAFNIYVINLKSRDLEAFSYRFDGDSYICFDDSKNTVNKNRFRQKIFEISKDFRQESQKENFFIDLTKNKFDYYVFPYISVLTNKNKYTRNDINSFDSFYNIVSNGGIFSICGDNCSSKTTTLNYIFDKLYNINKVPIVLDGNSLRIGFKKAIKAMFEYEYKSQNNEYDKFLQINKRDRVLLIDNLQDYYTQSYIDLFSEAQLIFDTIIFTTNKEFNLNITSQLNLIDITQFKIHPFYKEKRDQLVNKILCLMHQDNQEIFENIVEALDNFKQHFLKQPLFLISLIKYYINNSNINDKMIFSKMFEFNLNQLIHCDIKELTNDNIILILEDIAFYIYKQQSIDVDNSSALLIIKEYLVKKGHDKINEQDVLSLLIKSSILANTESGVCFSQRVYYSYFTAKKIKRLSEYNNDEFSLLLKFSCYNNNDEIALFVIYLFDSERLLKLIIEYIYKTIETWKEFETNCTKFLFSNNNLNNVVEHYDLDVRINEKQEKTNIEKKNYSKDNMDGIVKYEETKELNDVEKMLCVLSILILISRAFSAFEHLLDLQDKEKCVEIIYRVPLCIFRLWAEQIDKDYKKIIDNFQLIKEKK